MTLNADMEKRLAALDASLRRGISEADSGRVKPAEDVFERLQAKYKAIVDKTK
ncbi:hypothetical protein [Mesorhizobium caraganae]|uniref:hypothetical protein n=1 Tax=Mesorhizobium caraganae TaxID=483206 RepID=UPI001FE7CDA0|nr:hypothetical protein [Mesorhizobium caraganae]